MMTSFDERQLISDLQAGERGAFEKLLDLYEDRVYNVVRAMIGTHDAEDVAQEALIEICNSVRSFRGRSKLNTWIYRVAVNVCLEHRRKRRVLCVPLEDDLVEAQLDTHIDPAVAVIRNEVKGDVDAALEMLPEKHRDAVILHEIQGLTYRECAQVLNCPVGTVKSRLSNAFIKLRELLGGYCS
ncbi:RNA polymerase sigma factor [bacterium]|nr:RNA polymerase sigma factor [bacterium]